MSGTNDRSTVFSEGAGLTALALLSATLGLLIVLPYLTYVLLAIVLAYVLTPIQRRFERRVSSTIAALALILVTLLAILLPIVYVLSVAIQEGIELVAAVRDGRLDPETIETRLEAVRYLAALDDLYAAFQEPIATGLQGIVTSALEVLGGVPELLIGLTVMVFVLFSLLRDGGRFVTWLRTVIPVEDDVQRELLDELDRLMWASVVGNVAVAGIQAVLLGIGLVLIDVPAVIFLTVATFVLALLPLIGAFAVWFPLSIYLVVVGRPIAGAFVFGYGTLVSASDNYLRPALIGKGSAFSVATVVVGIFGGLVVFGAVGLFVGPVVLGGAKIVLDLFARERAEQRSADV